MWAIRIGALMLATLALLAQRRYTPGDVQDGERLFLANCSGCHGPEGDAVPGVDLGHGKFRHASTDDDLIKIIQRGIAGTAMPPNNFNNFQSSTIVAYLRDMAESARRSALPAGDAAQGKHGCRQVAVRLDEIDGPNRYWRLRGGRCIRQRHGRQPWRIRARRVS